MTSLAALAPLADEPGTLADGLAAVPWTELLGRLHPVALHLPVGLLVALALVEAPRLVGRGGRDTSRAVLVTLLAISGPLAALSGWLLRQEGGYGDPAELHQKLGIALGALCLAVGVAYRRQRAYGLTLLATLALMVPAAHLGATLTHGDDFLLEPWHAATAARAEVHADITPVAAAPDALLADGVAAPGDEPAAELTPAARLHARWAGEVLPVLAAYCTDCHGPRRQKGDLALDTLASLLIGGDGGEVLVPGSTAESWMVEAVHLDLDADEHMPPAKKPQPTAEEFAYVEAWIADLTPELLAEVAALDAASPALAPEPPGGYADDGPRAGFAGDAGGGPLRSSGGDAQAPGTAAPAATDLAALAAAFVHAEPIVGGPGNAGLWVDSAGADLDPVRARELLEPLVPFLVDVRLPRAAVDDALLATLARAPRLARLDLRGADLTQADLGRLAPAASLEELNLAGAHLGDGAAARAALEGFATLRRVGVWGTSLDGPQAAALLVARPELAVLGDDGFDEPLEVEPEPVFVRGGAADHGDLTAATDTPASLAPVNSVCPVTGAPVDPRYVVVHDGQAVGFCCPNCPKTFWGDPQAFPVALAEPPID